MRRKKIVMVAQTRDVPHSGRDTDDRVLVA
jgi:hypothetical protein